MRFVVKHSADWKLKPLQPPYFILDTKRGHVVARCYSEDDAAMVCAALNAWEVKL